MSTSDINRTVSRVQVSRYMQEIHPPLLVARTISSPFSDTRVRGRRIIAALIYPFGYNCYLSRQRRHQSLRGQNSIKFVFPRYCPSDRS
jgi:hypothetical protein